MSGLVPHQRLGAKLAHAAERIATCVQQAQRFDAKAMEVPRV